MTKPSEIVTWATDANYAADGDSWGGTPTKVDPGAARRAEGIEPDTFPAQWMNYHLNALGKHVEYVEGVLEATDTIPAVTRAITFGAFDFERVPDSSILSGAGAVKWELYVSGGVTLAWRTQAIAGTDYLVLRGGIRGRVPHGATITRIVGLFETGAALAQLADRAQISLNGRTGVVWDAGSLTTFAGSDGSRTTLASAVDDGSASVQLIDTGAISVVVASDTDYDLLIRSQNDAAVTHFAGLRIEFTDPGPRNH